VLGNERLDGVALCIRTGNPDHLYSGDQRQITAALPIRPAAV
jgi:hypothetical protein